MVMKPRAKSIGVSNRILPPHIVPIQLKILIPVGIAISMVSIEKAEVANETQYFFCCEEEDDGDEEDAVSDENRRRRSSAPFPFPPLLEEEEEEEEEQRRRKSRSVKFSFPIQERR